MFKKILLFFGITKKKPKFDLEKSFEDYKNRKIYPRLTIDIINNYDKNDLDSLVLDSLNLRLKDINNPSKEFEIVNTWSKGQQAVFSTFELDSEVLNGGFNQFYFNSSKIYYKLAENGLKLLGSKKYLELMINANSIYLKYTDHFENFDVSTAEGFIESYIDSPLGDLDDIFYDLDEIKSIKEFRCEYILKNISEFTD